MSEFNYQRYVESLGRLLDRYSKTLILRSILRGVYDPSTSSSVNTSSDSSVEGVILRMRTRIIGEKLRDGSLVETTDKRCIVKGDLTIELLDKIVEDTVVYTIVGMFRYQPGDTPVYIELILRRD